MRTRRSQRGFIGAAGLRCVSPGRVQAREIAFLKPIFWYRWGKAITVATGVSAWADQSGNARDMAQGTAANQPALQTDLSFLCDGSNDGLLTSNFAADIAQPLSIYAMAKQVTWSTPAGQQRIVGGQNKAASAECSPFVQHNTTPKVAINAGGALFDDAGDWAVGMWAAQCSVINVAASLRQMNSNPPVTGTVSTTPLGRVSVGFAGDGSTGPANCQIREVVGFAAAHNAYLRTRVVVRYLRQLARV